MTDSPEGWWFAPAGERPEVGALVTQRGCAFKRIVDALSCAPADSTAVYRIRLSGEVFRNVRKTSASEHTYLERFEVGDVLREFARKQALINIEKIKPYCAQEDYALIVEWLEAGEEELREPVGLLGEAVAEKIAWSLDGDAANAAWSVVGATAESAALAAAWSVEWAVWTGAEATANTMLEEMVRGTNK